MHMYLTSEITWHDLCINISSLGEKKSATNRLIYFHIKEEKLVNLLVNLIFPQHPFIKKHHVLKKRLIYL